MLILEEISALVYSFWKFSCRHLSALIMYGGLEGRREGERREVKKQLLNSWMKGMKHERSEK